MGEQSETGLSREAVLERGFISRVFYVRGGRGMHQLYADAMSIGVRDDWFTDPSSRVIWRAATRLFSSGDFSKASLANLIRESAKVIHETNDEEEKNVTLGIAFFDDCNRYVRPDDDVKSYGALLLDAFLGRKAREAMTNAVDAIEGGDGAVAAISRLITQSQELLATVNPTSQLSLAKLGEEVVQEYVTAHTEIVEKGNVDYTPGLKLPWHKLAYAINGFGSDLFILAARPGVGKTSMALNFARFWLDQGYKVVFNSVDMSPKGFVKRVLSEKSRISSRMMQFARSSDFNRDIERIRGELGWLTKLEESGNFKVLKEYDIDSLKANVSIMKDQGKIDVLIVDYLQLMQCQGAARIGATAKATYISNTLHAMAVELDIPILCLSQLNRDNTKDGGRDPQLSDLRDSGAIEQDAAAVMLLYRDDSVYREWKETEPPTQYVKGGDRGNPSLQSYCPIWCLLAKSREGDTGVKIPFVVVQSKYAWYQGDCGQKGKNAFARVYDDWRHDPIERVWEENGALIRNADRLAMEQANRRARQTDFGVAENADGVGNGGAVGGSGVSAPSGMPKKTVSAPVVEPAPWDAPMVNPVIETPSDGVYGSRQSDPQRPIGYGEDDELI